MNRKMILTNDLVKCVCNGPRIGKVVKTNEKFTTVLIDGEYYNYNTCDLVKI